MKIFDSEIDGEKLSIREVENSFRTHNLFKIKDEYEILKIIEKNIWYPQEIFNIFLKNDTKYFLETERKKCNLFLEIASKISEKDTRENFINISKKDLIALLLNKNVEAIKTLLRVLINKKLIRIDNLTRKNYYMLSSLGNQKLGQGNKIIKINYNELAHQNLLIKWLYKQNDIISYQTEKELKAEGHLIKDVWGNTKSKQGYPDLLVHYENKEMIIEFERTRKSKDKFKLKLNNLRSYLLQNIHILWLVPNESMKKFVDDQIKVYNWKIEQHHIEIFNDS